MLTVREATEKDLSEIVPLLDEMTITTSEVEKARTAAESEYRSVFRQIEADPNHYLLVAERDGAVVGTLVLLIVPNLSHGALPWALIENMVVWSDCRRQGIGKSLIEHAIAIARSNNCYKISLSSNLKRDDAHRFYSSMGFEEYAHGFRMYF